MIPCTKPWNPHQHQLWTNVATIGKKTTNPSPLSSNPLESYTTVIHIHQWKGFIQGYTDVHNRFSWYSAFCQRIFSWWHQPSFATFFTLISSDVSQLQVYECLSAIWSGRQILFENMLLSIDSIRTSSGASKLPRIRAEPSTRDPSVALDALFTESISWPRSIIANTSAAAPHTATKWAVSRLSWPYSSKIALWCHSKQNLQAGVKCHHVTWQKTVTDVSKPTYNKVSLLPVTKDTADPLIDSQMAPPASFCSTRKVCNVRQLL